MGHTVELLLAALCIGWCCIISASPTADIFENGRSDKEILDNLLKQTRYDKRLLPPVTG